MVEIIPAIDLKEGRCVRLMQGNYDKEIVYSQQPLEMALYWQEKGARRLHLVDLDGARDGRPENLAIIKEIVSSLTIPVQLGGGIRTMEIINSYLQVGVDRVILGTVALENPQLVKQAVDRYGSKRIVVGVDGRDGKVAVKGWLEDSDKPVKDLIVEMKQLGANTFIYTDISRDGMLIGPDQEGLRRFNQLPGIELIASGGVSSLEDLEQLAESGIKQAIVGKALYTGDISPEKVGLLEMEG